MNEELIAADLILLLLAAPSPDPELADRVNGITRLEKLLFLAEKERGINSLIPEDEYDFVAYNFGPYSRKVYQEIEVLEQAGLVSEERAYGGETLDEMEEVSAVGTDREGIERRFFLTDDGRAVARLLSDSHPDAVERLSEVKSNYGRLPLSRLVRYVYSKYPDYAENSVIRDRVLGRS